MSCIVELYLFFFIENAYQVCISIAMYSKPFITVVLVKGRHGILQCNRNITLPSCNVTEI